MKLVVAEKPSVMRDIAAVLGAAQKTADGALCGNGYIVTSARGHLVRLKQPDEYNEGYKKWSLSDLPIMPDFQFVPIENAVSVLKTLARQMNSSKIDEIIEATDAGREGECIFRYIYNYIGCTKPVRRLWISSMTEASIRDGFANLKPASEYDNLYSAGFTRSKIDWLWGINLTRLYTSYFGAKCSIGRVRTAVLNMLVQCENEISNFVKRPFYKVKLSNGAEWFTNNNDNLPDRISAEKLLAKCKNQQCRVISVKSQKKKENRPLLFSLTSLQIAANDELGFSAARTLSVMQSLYEKKLLTYPRTDSSYLTDDMAEILPGRVEMLRAFEEKAVNILLSNGLNIDGRIINNAKVSDHHAIIPTENIGNAVNMELTSDEKQILHLVIRRLLEAISAQYEYMDIEYVFDICGETFKLKQKKPVNLGWKALCPDDVEIPPEINCSENDTFYAEDIFITEGETKPPKRYTESSLLKAMENIDRRIEDKELSGYVSERGLGTPATRAAIIEKILADGYAERKNKVISATEMGIKMINFVPPEIKSVEMTAAMELQLAAIENGTASADEVISSITEKIRDIIEAEKHRAHTPISEPRTSQKTPVGKCPRCGGNVYKFVRDNTGIFYCEKAPKDCIFRVYEDDYFFTSKGKKLTEPMMKNLLSHGEVKVSGFKSEKTGNAYNAVVSFADRTDKNGNAKIGFTMRFEDKKKAGQYVVLPSAESASKSISRKGYKLLGFSDNTDIAYPLYDYKMPYEDVKLFAVWEPDIFTVTYNSNGGTGQLSRAEVRYGDSVPLPKDASIYRDSLFLTGWAKTNNAKSALKSLTMPAENLTLYAVWSKKPPTAKITLHYDDKVQVIEAEIGSTLDMLDDFGVPKDGEIVSGWYFENSPVRVEDLDVSGDCDLYAKWQSATYITISVDQSYLNKADIEYKMPLDMTGYAKLTLPVVDDKNDIYNSVFGCTYGYSTKKQNGDFGTIEYYGGVESKFSKSTKLYRVLNEYGGGKGTAENPYIISYYDQLLRLSEQGAKGYFVQTADIAFPRNTDRNPISTKKITRGYENKSYDYFVYDGQSYSIKNISGDGGLFGTVAAGTIQYVVVDGANIKVGNNKNLGVICNEIVSYAYPSTDTNEYFSTGNTRIIGCKVLNSKITADCAENIGGICGFGGDISDCMADGITVSGGKSIGGIVGNACTVTGCIANNITVSGSAVSAGGIAGTAYGVELFNSGEKPHYAGGSIIGCGVRTFTSTAENSGGIVGTATAHNVSAYIKSCYAANIYLNGTNNGGIAGADGNENGHKILYCIVDNANNYPVIGKRTRSSAKTMILSVPADTGLTVEGVLSVLNAKSSGYGYWERSDSVNGGYPYPCRIFAERN